MRAYLVISLLIAVVAVIFSIQNSHTAAINVAFWTVDGSLALIIIATFVMGTVVGVLGTFAYKRRKKKASNKTSPPEDHADRDLAQPW